MLALESNYQQTMEYVPITPVSTPTLKDSLLGARTTSCAIPQLSFLEEQELVVASNLAAPDSTQITYRRTHTFYRLSESPIKLRHNGSTVDQELYVDQYSFVQDSPAPKAPQVLYPPADPFSYDWGADSYYQRTTSIYVFSSLSVPTKSSLVWDGRYAICVNSAGATVDNSNRVPKVQGLARTAIENPGMPKYSQGLSNLGQTKKPENYSASLNVNEYNVYLQRFLDEHYNANSIPPVPISFSDLDVISDGLPISSSEGTGLTSTTLAALLNGDYFVKWVAFTTTGGS